MNLELNDDQRILSDTLERFVKQSYDYPARRALVRTESGYAQAHWQLFADIGLLALPLPEQYGGLNADFSYLGLVMEWIGKGLVAEPYLASVILGGGTLRRLPAAPLPAACLAALAAGQMTLALADDEADPAAPLRAILRHDGLLVDGAKRLVVHGTDADRIIVTARIDGELALLLVDARQAGVERRAYRTVDGLPACDLVLHGLVLAKECLLAQGAAAEAILREVLTEAMAALCAEACGCMQALFDMTLEYVQQRKQFGRAIGSFQVIQHRLAEAFTDLEQVKSMALLATRSVSSAAPGRHRDVAAAKAFIGEAALSMGHTAIQLHGAMGMTEELAVGGYHKRLLVINALLGDARSQLGRWMAMDDPTRQAA